MLKMGLLDKATIITTPTAQSNGKLHSIKGGSVADFDVVRGSSATRVNAEGLIEDISLLSGELVTNGYFATDSWWTLGQFWSIANGFATRAVVGSELNYSVSRSNLLTIGKSYKVEIDVNSVDSGSVKLVLGSTNSTEYTSDGVYVFEGVCTSSTSFKISPSNDFNGSIDSISVKEVIDATNIPRIDYTTGEGVILTEPQSTNLITYSEDFSNAYWTKTGASVVSGFTSPSADAPLGAFKLVESGLNEAHHIVSWVGTDGTFTQSIYAKKGERTWLIINIGGGADRYNYFDLLNGVVGNINGTTNQKMELLSNGWYKISFKISSWTGGGKRMAIYTTIGNGVTSYLGDGTSGVYLYGAQLEALSYSTSYIPTSGAIATRLADSLSGAGDSSTFNDSEGVLFGEFSTNASDNNSNWINISDGTANNWLFVGRDGDKVRAYLKSNGVVIFSNHTTPLADINKVALSYKSGDVRVYINGVKVVNLTSAFSFSLSLNQLNFGVYNGGATTTQAAWKQVGVYNTSLTDEELTCLTTI